MAILEASGDGVRGIFAGVLMFSIAPLLDWVSLKRLRHVKPFVTLLVTLLQIYAIYAVSFNVDRFSLPLAATVIGWFLLPISVLLMTYSWFLEIPFAKTYARSGVGDKLVTTGTYALTRHPGVLWYGLFLASLLLVTRSLVLAVAAPVWLALDLLWVLLQDKFFFVQMFPSYGRYQEQTPMLLPTKQSMRRCLKTLNQGGKN